MVARLLHAHCGVRLFGVATLAEALELRAAGLHAADGVRLLVLGATVENEWKWCKKFGIEFMIESARTARALLDWPDEEGGGGPFQVHVMLNTGMNRIGLATYDGSTETHGRRPDPPRRPSLAAAFGGGESGGDDADTDAPPPAPPVLSRAQSTLADTLDSVAELAASPSVHIAGLCTHMADAGNSREYTRRQFGRFKDAVVALAARGVTVP